MVIDIEQLASMMSGIYGHVKGEKELLKQAFGMGIVFALGALTHEICEVLEELDPEFDTEDFKEKCGYRRAKASIGQITKDQ